MSERKKRWWERTIEEEIQDGINRRIREILRHNPTDSDKNRATMLADMEVLAGTIASQLCRHFRWRRRGK